MQQNRGCNQHRKFEEECRIQNQDARCAKASPLLPKGEASAKEKIRLPPALSASHTEYPTEF
ncbi:hypothetical protein CK516_00755 [Nostoc sp. 'Peltigera malacea cyanobiont' DB3992]|nr:hypothetical protein CK516_00755 [Nostoc sp. 'Peltigera malacea cyanobiont' DB3992]